MKGIRAIGVVTSGDKKILIAHDAMPVITNKRLKQKTVLQRLRKAHTEAENELKKDILPRIYRNEITIDQANAEHEGKVWSIINEKMKKQGLELNYTRKETIL